MISKTQKKLLNPEYADSEERLNALRNIIVDGKDAEAVIKYAQIFVDECQAQLLDKAKNNQKTDEAALEYRVAFKFMELLKHAADLGKQKEDVFQTKRRGY